MGVSLVTQPEYRQNLFPNLHTHLALVPNFKISRILRTIRFLDIVYKLCA